MQKRIQKETGNNCLKRIIVAFLAVIMMTTMLHPQMVQAATGTENGIFIESKNHEAPVFEAGKKKNWNFVITNNSGNMLNNVTITPDLGDKNEDWPFKTEKQSYQKSLETLKNGQQQEVSFEFIQRDDVPTTRYKLKFTISADGQEETAKWFYMNTTAKPVQKDTQDNKDNKDTDEGKDTGKGNGNGAGSGSDTSYQTPDAGGYSNGEAAYSGGSGGSTDGGEASGNGSVPRVIVTGFTTDPAEVRAGSNFKLTIHLKNTSKRTAVSNMLVNFNAPSEGSDTENTYAAFLPTSGSNTAYISSIGKNATTDLSIEMTAKSDLSQKPYQLDVTMDYEDDAYTAYTSTADVSIPIHQAAKFELSTPEILPATISVGNEADIMFSIYNTGKTTLYNVQVKFEGDSVTGGESFIGKIEAGGTGTVDALVTGQAATKDDGTIKAVITYEDEAGNESSYEQEMTLMVTEDTGLAGMDDWDMEEVEYDDSTGSSKKAVIITLIGVVLLTIAVVIVILLKKRKAKKLLAEELDLLEEDDEETDSVDDGEKDKNGKDDADEIS